jgi:hypothetical protein
VTQDEKSLLKHGLFWAVAAGGSFWLTTVIRSRFISVIALIVCWAFFYIVFYRDAHKNE